MHNFATYKCKQCITYSNNIEKRKLSSRNKKISVNGFGIYLLVLNQESYFLNYFTSLILGTYFRGHFNLPYSAEIFSLCCHSWNIFWPSFHSNSPQQHISKQFCYTKHPENIFSWSFPSALIQRERRNMRSYQLPTFQLFAFFFDFVIIRQKKILFSPPKKNI